MSIRQIIDEGKLSSMQVLVIGICFLLNMLDGMDVLAITYSADFIVRDWNMESRAQLGGVFSAALVGMALGAVFISPYTDKIGRRNMILLSMLVITLGMIATAFSQNVVQLMILRLLAGLGIGSMLASLTAMVSEYAPDRHRNFCILLLHAGYPIGAIFTGIVAAWVLPEFGWPALFVMAGITSLVFIPLVYFLMPESLDFLASRRPEGALERINTTLTKMQRQTLETLPEIEEKSGGAGIRALFVDGLAASTIRLWIAFMMAFATLYFLLSWVVKLAIDAGLPPSEAIYAGISLNVGAFFGSVTLGWLSAKLGLRRIIIIFLLTGGVFTIIYGNFGSTLAVVLTLTFLVQYFVQGGFTGLYAVAARLYATDIRTTGVGWAIGAGRVGAIMGPFIAGVIMDAGLPVNWTFVVYAGPLIIGAIALSGIPKERVG